MKASELRVYQFGQALQRLQDALKLPEDSIVRDACIQRFEFTFETAWKAVQADAAAEGTECASPRDCFRTAFRMGIIDLNETSWLKMVEDRNRESFHAQAHSSWSREWVSLLLPLFDAILSR